MEAKLHKVASFHFWVTAAHCFFLEILLQLLAATGTHDTSCRGDTRKCSRLGVQQDMVRSTQLTSAWQFFHASEAAHCQDPTCKQRMTEVLSEEETLG